MAETDGLDWGRRKNSDDEEEEEIGDGSETVRSKEKEYGEHEYYDPQNEEENADMGVLDYDYSSIEEKIGAGLREKEKGNKLFKQGKYEEAWKQYDRCFVQVYTSKEEWSAIGNEGRQAINNFKLPCHLNRGLCRLRKDDVTNALWDFSEALRIDENNIKALYRKGITLLRMTELDFEKEKQNELWDLDITQNHLIEAKQLLLKAFDFNSNDMAIRKAFNDCKQLKSQLTIYQKNYKQQQKKMYSNFISNLDKDNQRLKNEQDKHIFDDMPKLEKIRIE